MELPIRKTQNEENIAAPVVDIRSRIDGETRFRRSFPGFNVRQVNDYIAEMAETSERQSREHQAELEELRQRLRGQEQEAQALQERLDAAEARREMVREEENAWQGRIDQLTVDLARREDELAQARQELEKWQEGRGSAEMASLSRQVEELSQDNASLLSEESRLNSLLTASQNQCRELEQRNLALETDAELCRQDMLELKLARNRGFSAAKSLQTVAVAALVAQLESSISYLREYEKEAGEQLHLASGVE